MARRSACARPSFGSLCRLSQAVVEVGRHGRDRQRQRGLTEPFHVSGHEAMSGKVNDTVIGKRQTLHRRLARILFEMDIARGRPELAGYCLELVGRVEQGWKS